MDDPRFAMMPADMIGLQREISSYHPELREQLTGITELHEWYATVATYAGIAVDGAFGPAELQQLTDMLRKKLVKLRNVSIVYSPRYISPPTSH